MPPFTVKWSYPVMRRASDSGTFPMGGGVRPSRQSTRDSPTRGMSARLRPQACTAKILFRRWMISAARVKKPWQKSL